MPLTPGLRIAANESARRGRAGSPRAGPGNSGLERFYTNQ